MNEELTEYFADWDPLDFIADLQAPRDEYSLEAQAICERFSSRMTAEEVGVLTYQVFVEFIEVDYEGFREEAIERGEAIKAIIDKRT